MQVQKEKNAGLPVSGFMDIAVRFNDGVSLLLFVLLFLW